MTDEIRTAAIRAVLRAIRSTLTVDEQCAEAAKSAAAAKRAEIEQQVRQTTLETLAAVEAAL